MKSGKKATGHSAGAHLRHTHDIADLRKTCESLDAPNTILDLQLTGHLRENEIADLNAMLNGIGSTFLNFSQDRNIAAVLDAAAIASRFHGAILSFVEATSSLLAAKKSRSASGSTQLLLIRACCFNPAWLR